MKRKLLLKLLQSAMLSLLTAFSMQAQEKSSATQPDSTKPTPSKPAVGDVPADFVIGSGDVLNIFVWKEAEVSRTVPVRPDGKISLPLINDVQAAGLTAMQLKDLLTEKLKQFIAEPTVTVTVETVNSQKVLVTGEVTGGGSRPLTGPTRIMDILSSVGLTPFAKTSKIYLLRNEAGKQQRFPFNYKDYLKGKNQDQNLLLKNGDTIVVP